MITYTWKREKDRICKFYIRGLIMKDSNRTKEDIYRKFQNPA